MATRIFVGSLGDTATDTDLHDAFSAFGTVTSANVIIDRDSRRPKGFGFVEMSTSDEAKAAISGLDGKELAGKNMVVNEARPRANRPGGTGRY